MQPRHPIHPGLRPRGRSGLQRSNRERLALPTDPRNIPRSPSDIHRIAVSTEHLKHLEELRNRLVLLHKALVEAERSAYEQTMGPIPSANHFLRLLTQDPWFAWLHPLSELIVSMDMALDNREEPLTPAGVAALVGPVRPLLTPTEEGDGFGRNYFDAMQRDPDVILAHASVGKLLGKPRA